MKYIKIMVIPAVLLLLLSSSACLPTKGNANQSHASAQAAQSVLNEPELATVRSICELATLECYYHNVAKGTKSEGTGLMHFGEIERKFWIEYTGVATIGIDMSEVTMTIEGENVTITMPKAKVLSCKVEEISEDDYILSEDSWLNSNPITADEQTKAIADAQEEMKLSVENNTSIMDGAQRRAKTLIENYIHQMGELSGVDYQVIWNDSE